MFNKHQNITSESISKNYLRINSGIDSDVILPN